MVCGGVSFCYRHFSSTFFPASCEIRRKVSGAPLIRTFHAPAAVINTNERVSPTAPERPARISSKQTSELTARNIEPRGWRRWKAEIKISLVYWHAVLASSRWWSAYFGTWPLWISCMEFMALVWLTRVYHTKHFPLGGEKWRLRADSYNMTLAIVDHDLITLIISARY